MRRPQRLLILLALALGACGGGRPESVGQAVETPPSILLVTLDTTRYDAVAPGRGVAPTIEELALRGLWFEQAYATAPQTLPSHVSMLTGLLPAAHGVHENGRVLREDLEPIAVRLAAQGYRTAAFVSSYTLEGGLGLTRGFDTYDDTFSVRGIERSAVDTTNAALAWLAAAPPAAPVFLWVHYFDPHDPYQPPEPFASRFSEQPYLGEVAAMDAELARVVDAFERRSADSRILLVGDHGESLGEHGEATHGNLVYQGVMHVPLLIVGGDLEPERRQEPVSTRRVFDTLAGWGGLAATAGLEQQVAELVVGEAMQPYLSYGWSPQVMVVKGPWKLIRSQGHELYDVIADPGELADLADRVELDREQVRTARDYPLPDPAAGAPLDGEQLAKLASLGYVGSSVRSQVREDAPRPRDMVHLLPALERGSALFSAGSYREAIPLFAGVLEQDPRNLMVAVRLGVAHSLLGETARADQAFDQARSIDAGSLDLMLYHALHLLRSRRVDQAEPQLELVLARDPSREPALEALARIRQEQGRLSEAADLLARLAERSRSPAAALTRLGMVSMELGRTDAAIGAFERALALQGDAFENDLELGVLYLAVRRLDEAAAALDRVPAAHPGFQIASFKRAQVAVLRREPDAAARVEELRRSPDPDVRELVANERLFAGR